MGAGMVATCEGLVSVAGRAMRARVGGEVGRGDAAALRDAAREDVEVHMGSEDEDYLSTAGDLRPGDVVHRDAVAGRWRASGPSRLLEACRERGLSLRVVTEGAVTLLTPGGVVLRVDADVGRPLVPASMIGRAHGRGATLLELWREVAPLTDEGFPALVLAAVDRPRRLPAHPGQGDLFPRRARR